MRHHARRRAHASPPHQIRALGLTWGKADNPAKAHQHHHPRKPRFSPTGEGYLVCLTGSPRTGVIGVSRVLRWGRSDRESRSTTRIVLKERKISDR
jgi:hypothetical protein